MNAATDPAAALFAVSLFPYLLFLWWAKRSGRFPALALWGFGLTLLFVLITIGAALVAQLRYGAELANVDWLHGGAEAFLSLSNLVLLLGFATPTDGPAPGEGAERPSNGPNNELNSGEQVLRAGAEKDLPADD
ncbi:MAG: hypothetical protein RLZZ158_358 [Cyanobacteriota bacterium]|jgi:heme A synthase